MVDCLLSPHEQLLALNSAHGPYAGVYSDHEDDELQRALTASSNLHRAIENQRAESQIRLKKTAASYGAKVWRVKADGNCQFRALSVAIYGHEDSHDAVRAKVIEQLRRDPREYSDFLLEPCQEYLERMARDGEWGDNVTLQAASDALNRRLQVLTDVPGASLISVFPKKLRSAEGLVQQPLWSLQEPLYLTFQAEWHYDAAVLIR